MVPTIDISPFVGPGPATEDAKAKALDEIRTACLESGFFVITGHGVPEDLQQRALAMSKSFFALPLEEKLELSEKKAWGRSFRGYQIIGGEAYEAGKLPDLKEGFQIGIHKSLDHPDSQRQRSLTGPNVWPASLQPDFENTMLSYFDSIRMVSFTLMKMLAMTLNIDFEQHFASFCIDSLQAIRLLHYPPQPMDASKDQLGTGAHTDFGAVTCLLTDGTPGLQVKKDDGTWENVTCEPGAYIVNLGDVFSKLTAGVYKSSMHRVINTSDRDRYSIPCFLDGNLDAVVRSVIAGPKPELRYMTVEEHMQERFTTVRSRGVV